MSRALGVMLGLGIAAVVIYSIWKYYKEDKEEISVGPPLEEEEEPEISSVPRLEEVVEEELPFTPPTPPLDDWNTLATLEYGDLHVCPVCAMSFPSMSAMLWHVKLGHPSFPIQNTFPRYNKICVLLRILTPDGDPAVGIRVKLYQDQTLRGQFITDSYGCGDFIKMDAGTFRLSIDQTADYRGKELVLTLRLMTNEVQVVDMAGNKSRITVVTAALNSISLEKHGWVQIGPTWTGGVTAPPAPPAPAEPAPAPEPAPAVAPYTGEMEGYIERASVKCPHCSWGTDPTSEVSATSQLWDHLWKAHNLSLDQARNLAYQTVIASG